MRRAAKRDTVDISRFDLTTKAGRYLARKHGLDVPKLRSWTRASDASFDDRVKVMPSGCHEWQGGKVYGYGHFIISGKDWRAHRYAWTRANGPIPDGLVVMHLCDNPACVRLDHLRLGTNRENTQDAVSKGRQAHSERSKSRLKLEDVLAIRANHRRGKKSGEWTTGWIVDVYGIEKSTVRKIISRVSWRYA